MERALADEELADAAVSEDLLSLGLQPGTKVRIEGLRGRYRVADRTHSRLERTIDIYMGTDREAARRMVAAAASAGLERMIYLGGLAEARQGRLSKHLQSRIEVAEILQAGPVPGP